jgi:5-methylcytosine-specific restriction endonuclease McrA
MPWYRLTVTCQYAPCSKVSPISPSDLARGRGKYCSKACKWAAQGRASWKDHMPPGLDTNASEYFRHYRAANRERLNANDRAYAQAHRAEAIAKTKAWQTANPEKTKAHRAATARRHPETGRRKTQRYRARKHNAPRIEPINDHAIYTRDRWICQLCFRRVNPQGKKGEAPSLDHVIPLSQGGHHTAQNLVLTHWRCNRKKQARAVSQQQRLFG